MAERKMADALDELYNDGVKAKMKDFIIENIDTIVAQLAGKYLTQTDAQSQFASINTALSGKLGTTATAASASKVIGGTITLSGSVTGSGSFNSAGNVTINTSGGGTTYSTGTASTAGITKLYTSTGSSTDGTMTRQAITNELNNRVTNSTHNSDFQWLNNQLNNKADTSDLNSLNTTVNNLSSNKLDKSTWNNYFAESSILTYKLGTLGLQEGTGVIITSDNDDTFTVVLNKHNVRFNFRSDGIYLSGKKITN